MAPTSDQTNYNLDEHALADFTLRLIAARSPSGEEGEVARLVQEELERLGLDVAVDELGNVTGTLDAGPGPCVLVDSHMDTVGVSDPGAWSRDPGGERVGDRVYGRGAMDMKGPLAASVFGLAALRGRLRRGRAVISASVAEELVEGPALVHVARHVRPDVVVVCEATSLGLARGQRGRAEVQIELLGTATHSSRPELGVNAVSHMADVIAALRALELQRHPVLGDAILVVTDVISSPYPGLSVVPDRCLATFDRRTLPGETEEAVLAPIQRIVDEALAGTGASGTVRIAEDDVSTYTGAALRAPNFAPAWFFAEDAPHVEAASLGLRRAGLPVKLTHYAFCTNGSGSAGVLGIPTLGFGPGDETLAHRADEHVEIGELADGARGYAAIVEQLTAEA